MNAACCNIKSQRLPHDGDFGRVFTLHLMWAHPTITLHVSWNEWHRGMFTSLWYSVRMLLAANFSHLRIQRIRQLLPYSPMRFGLMCFVR